MNENNRSFIKDDRIRKKFGRPKHITAEPSATGGWYRCPVGLSARLTDWISQWGVEGPIA